MFEGMDYIYAVYREKSFSKAAAALYISQPSLSIMVKKEEERVGFPIFDRSTVPIRLTEPGKEYIRTAERMLEMKANFEAYVGELNELLTGTLSIGSTNLFVSYALPPFLSDFSRLYPQVHVQLMEAASAELAENLVSGDLELLLDNRHMDEQIYSSQLLYSEHLLLAVPKNIEAAPEIERISFTAKEICDGAHLDSGAECINLKNFKGAPFLFLKPGNDTRERESEICRRQHFEPEIRFELDQQRTAYNLSSAGLGISFVGDMLVRWDPRDELRFFKLSGADTVRDISFYYKKSRRLSRAAQEFLKLAEEKNNRG